MRFPTTQSLLVLIAVSTQLTHATRDDSYYANAVINPNTVRNDMYWKEPSNVLQDLDQFDKLYVQYHECAWSEILQQNGGGGGDDDTWYLKSVPRMGAQVAYSLHGVLKGHRDRKCSKATYILSAHTTSGLSGYTNVLANLGIEGFTAVQQNGEGDHQDNNNNNNNGVVSSNCQSQGGQGEQQGHRFLNEGQQNQQKGYYYEYNADQTSLGVTCHNKKFVQSEISGPYCTGTVQQVVDELTDFNALMSNQAKCVQIYARGDSEYSSEQDEDNSASPLSLLQYSYACWYQQSDCPDPYGKQRKYQQAVESVTNSNLTVHDQEVKARAATYLILSVAFLVGAVYLLMSPGRGGSLPSGYLERLRRSRRRHAAQKIKRMAETAENLPSTKSREWTGPESSSKWSSREVVQVDDDPVDDNESQSANTYDHHSQQVALSTDTSDDDVSTTSPAAVAASSSMVKDQHDQESLASKRKGFLTKLRGKR